MQQFRCKLCWFCRHTLCYAILTDDFLRDAFNVLSISSSFSSGSIYLPIILSITGPFAQNLFIYLKIVFFFWIKNKETFPELMTQLAESVFSTLTLQKHVMFQSFFHCGWRLCAEDHKRNTQRHIRYRLFDEVIYKKWPKILPRKIETLLLML
jgi:hypothetical protein